MKTINLLSLIFLALSLGSYTIHAAVNPNAVECLLKDCLDLSKSPEKPLSEFLKQLIKMIEGESKYKDFVADLKAKQDKKNANIIGMVFLKHKNKFPMKFQDMVTKMGVTKVVEILSQRIK